jgi:diadenylate cyclase
MPGDISSILQSFRVQDLVDIIMITIMIYGLLLWFKKTASRFVLVGIALLGIVYMLSRFFQLYMTAVILQSVFAVIMFALIVIFQEELKRFFERLAIWGRIRKKAYESFEEHDAEIIAQCVREFSRKRIGALIVLQGEEPLERHIQGGTRLDGILSPPLLESIFDPHSMGHDGAVMVDQGKIVRFGVHLPLSSNVQEFGNLGLRHTAALGLSERSDALCIVVSEERGTISVARDKELRILDNAAKLKVVLDDFYEKKIPRKKAILLHRWFRENFAEKATAVLLACLIWVGFGYQRETVQRDVMVPVEYRALATEWVMEEPKITEAKVMLKGPEQAFRLYDTSKLKISLDMSQVKQGGQEVTLTKDMINAPSSLSVVGIKPERIYVTAYRLLKVSLPVEVRTTGSLPQNVALQRMEISPPTVHILISPRLRNNGVVLRTKPLDLSSISTTTTFYPEILIPPEARFIGDKQPPVAVTVKVRSKTK